MPMEPDDEEQAYQDLEDIRFGEPTEPLEFMILEKQLWNSGAPEARDSRQVSKYNEAIHR